MLKDTKEKKYCNCPFSSNKDIFKANINHSFCSKCGSILIKTADNNIYYSLKTKQKIKESEINPIEMIKSMKEKTEFEYPYLNEEYNMSNEEKLDIECFTKSIKLYLKHRKMIILTLQKMMKMLDYTDLIFYQCLFYMDTILSHNITEDFTEKKIIFYLVGYFLCSAKSKENDIYEPSLDLFCYIKKKDHLSIDKIAYYEVICLKSIKYNIFCYSAYDWISQLNSIGLVFNCEIDEKNAIILINGHRHSIINIIIKNALKMLLNITIKNIFIKYSPMYIAFSLIQISREKYLDKNLIRPELFNNLINLYGVKFSDYKKCYKEIKEEIDENPKRKSKNIEIEIEENYKVKNNIEKNAHSEKFKLLHTEKDLPSNNNFIIGKNVSMANKMKSNIALPNIGEFPNNLKNEEIKAEDNNDNCSIDGNENSIDNFKNDNDDCNKSKDNNIIIYDENNEEKNKDSPIDFNLILNINKEDENRTKVIESSKNKIKSSQNLNRVKIKNKSHLSINCISEVHKSDINLPKINTTLEHNLNNLDKNKMNRIINLKRISYKISPNNIFLKSNNKGLKPIQTKTFSNSTDKKPYYKSNSNNNLNNNNFEKKTELNSMRKSLFFDKSNINKKENNNGIIAINKNFKKMRSEIPQQIKNFKNLIKENINDRLEEMEMKSKNNNNANNEENNKSKQCKSKSKLKNNFVGKEIKAYVINSRNQRQILKKELLKEIQI